MAIVEISYQRDPTTGQVIFDASGYPLVVADPTANTYGQMQTRVSNEVLGAITATDVQNAIQDAIETFERESFWFNDMRYFGGATGSLSNLQTVQGKEFYSYQDLPVLASNPHIMKMYVFAFNNRYPLVQRTPQWIQDQSLSPTWQGLPTDWCWIAGGVQLYPIPNGAYPLIVEGTIRLPVLSADADYNAWTNRAERLIRSEAKRRLFIDLTRDSDQATRMEMEVYGNPGLGRQGALAELRRETMRRAGGPGKLRPSRGYMS